MTGRFKKFIPFILKWECVFDKRGNVVVENDPDDPGGKTYAGLDKASHPHFDYEHPTLEKAIDVYFEEWDKQKIESYPFPLGEVIFNSNVNCGPGRTKKILEKAYTAEKFLDEQAAFYERLCEARPALKKFKKGWLNRVDSLREWIKK